MMTKPIVLITVVAITAVRCLAARCGDLAVLCDATEAFFRAEEKVISQHEPRWAPYAKALLAVRLADLDFQRAEFALIQRDETRPVAVSTGGWCGLRIGKGDSSKAIVKLVDTLKEFHIVDPDIGVKYVDVTAKWQSEIRRECGIDNDGAQFRQILKRYIPHLEE
jgi:hypothetical protein